MIAAEFDHHPLAIDQHRKLARRRKPGDDFDILWMLGIDHQKLERHLPLIKRDERLPIEGSERVAVNTEHGGVFRGVSAFAGGKQFGRMCSGSQAPNEREMKKAATTKQSITPASPSALIDARIAALGDWRGETLARVRGLIRAACPEAFETWKWRGVPVWEHAGILCTGETYKDEVKLDFRQGRRDRGPLAPVQCQPRRQCAPRHRHPRGREDQ